MSEIMGLEAAQPLIFNEKIEFICAVATLVCYEICKTFVNIY